MSNSESGHYSGGADREDEAVAMARWQGKAESNIKEWGLQDEETLLLAMQEELGELTQSVLEARYEDGSQLRIDGELDDLGALLVQFHRARNSREVGADTDRSEGGQSDG